MVEKTTEVTDKEPTKKAEKSIETNTKGLDDAMVEGLAIETSAETPVIYPGCEGTEEEIRACSRKKFVKFIVKDFDKGLVNDMDLKAGDHKIRAIVKVSTVGKVSVIRVDSPNEALSNEVINVINNLPMMTPATKGGKAIDVYFVLPVNFKVEN